MKTKTVPVIIMLIAGAVACILGMVNNYTTAQFLKMMLTVLVVFYILGCMIKLILDKNFPIEETSENDEAHLVQPCVLKASRLNSQQRK